MSQRGSSPKQISEQAFIGEEGANLIARHLLLMRFAWTPTPGAFDAGIDGTVELRDPETGAALNSILRVQSKATKGPWAHETDRSFEYTCDERDLTYWLAGNTPVLLVVSRPVDDEAYWVSIKDYFRDPARLRTRKVHFDKRADRFDGKDPALREKLLRLGLRRDAGVYLAPPRRRERLFSNLLTVSRLPTRLFLGVTHHGSRREIVDAHESRRPDVREWVLRGKRVLSVHDLSAPLWRRAVDRGTVEEFETWEWATSEDPERVGDFTELLNRCLGQRAWQIGLALNQSDETYYFPATADLSPRTVAYRSVQRTGERTVFSRHATKKSGESVREFYRHSAFLGRFRRYEGEWMLEITPTYRFTSDGYRPLKYAESKLKGIKALEKNATVLSQVVMWAALLRGETAAERQRRELERVPARERAAADARRQNFDLFGDTQAAPPVGTPDAHSPSEAAAYEHLQFDELRSFLIDVGINEKAWLADDEEGRRDETAAETLAGLPLFTEEPYAD